MARIIHGLVTSNPIPNTHIAESKVIKVTVSPYLNMYLYSMGTIIFIIVMLHLVLGFGWVLYKIAFSNSNPQE